MATKSWAYRFHYIKQTLGFPFKADQIETRKPLRLSLEERMQLLSFISEIDHDDLGISCKFLTVTYSTFSSVSECILYWTIEQNINGHILFTKCTYHIIIFLDDWTNRDIRSGYLPICLQNLVYKVGDRVERQSKQMFKLNDNNLILSILLFKKYERLNI